MVQARCIIAQARCRGEVQGGAAPCTSESVVSGAGGCRGCRHPSDCAGRAAAEGADSGGLATGSSLKSPTEYIWS